MIDTARRRFLLLFFALLTAGPALAQEGPARAPSPADEIEIFVPEHPRTAGDIDRLDALRDYVAARALEAQRQWSDAIALLEEAREREPGSVAILRRLARLHFGLGHTDDGVETSRAAIEADPQDSETIRRLVRHYRSANQEEAAEVLLSGLVDDPDLPAFCLTRLVVLHDLGGLLVDEGRSPEAVGPYALLVEALDSKEATRLTPAQLQTVLGEDEADAYRRFGEVFYNAGRYDLAIIALRRSLTYDPGSPETPLYLAQALLRNDQPEEALRILEPIVTDPPPGRVAFDVLDQILGALGRSEEMVERLERAVEHDPKNLLLRYALAEQYEEGGRVAEAQELYKGLIADQSDPDGFAALTESLREDSKYGELLKLLETAWDRQGGRLAVDSEIRLIGTEPERARELLDVGMAMLRAEPPDLGPVGAEILAEIAARTGLDDQRIELDRLSVERDPSPQNYLELADSLAAAGRPGEAADTFADLIEQHPILGNELRLLSRMAELQFDAGRYEESLTTGRRVLLAQPNDLVTQQIIGFALLKLGRNDEAIELYRDLIKDLGGNTDAARMARIWLANAYVTADRFEAGEAELLELLEQQPDDPWVNNDLGYLWADRGINLEKAEAMTRKAVESEPENPAYLDSLGWALYKRGEFAEAVEYLAQAVELRASATNLDHLGDAYFSLGRTDDARSSWRRAAELADDADPPDPLLATVREKLEALGDDEPPPDRDAENP